MTAPISLRDLTKAFGARTAVDHVTLTVEPGEVVGFLGANGAGKSTTMRLVTGSLRPTAGEVHVFGGSVRDPDVRRRRTFLPGDLAFDPRWTGRDVFDLLDGLRGIDTTARTDELCQRLELDPSRPVGELSTGNRRKVGIVQAFAPRPDLLLLDEPTAGLDPLLQAAFDDLVTGAKADGAAVLLSSHVLPEVERSADRIAVIRHGRLVHVTDLDDLRRSARQHLHLVVDRPPPAAVLIDAPGVRHASVDGNDVTVIVEGSAQPVLDVLRGHDVVRVRAVDEHLDSLFRHLYEEPATT